MEAAVMRELEWQRSEEMRRQLKVCSICKTSELHRMGWRDRMLWNRDNNQAKSRGRRWREQM